MIWWQYPGQIPFKVIEVTTCMQDPWELSLGPSSGVEEDEGMATMPWQNPIGLRVGSSAYRRSVRHLAQRMTTRKRDLRRQHLAAADLIWPGGANQPYGEPCS